MDTKGLGKRIKELREQKELTAAELGALVGVTQGYISNLEGGHRTNPSLELIAAIAQALDTTVDYLTFGGVRVPLMNYAHLLPQEEADYVKSHRDDAWVVLIKEMKAEELSPESVAKLIQAVRIIKEKKGD